VFGEKKSIHIKCPPKNAKNPPATNITPRPPLAKKAMNSADPTRIIIKYSMKQIIRRAMSYIYE